MMIIIQKIACRFYGASLVVRTKEEALFMTVVCTFTVKPTTWRRTD